MITIDEASKLLGVTAKTMRLWEKEGKITSYRTEGGHRRYEVVEITQFKNKSIIEKNNIESKIKAIEISLENVKTVISLLK
jgi:excisionase family DNA binding protein